MPKTVTLRLSDEIYSKFKYLADQDNRTLSNFIVTAANRYVEEIMHADKVEMDEIRNNIELNKSLKAGIRDMKNKSGTMNDEY